MHYATYYPNEEMLVHIRHFKGHEPKLIDAAGPVSRDAAYKIARFMWGQKAMLIKYEPMLKDLFSEIQKPAPPPKPVISDEDFLKGFPKGLHAAMISTAKRNKAGIQEIFEKFLSGKPHILRLNQGWLSELDLITLVEAKISDFAKKIRAVVRAKE